MISKEEFIRQVTSCGHESCLRTMTITEIFSLYQSKEHDMCVWCPVNKKLREELVCIFEFFPEVSDETNMFVYKSRAKSFACRHEYDIQWLEGSNEWRGYDYYIIPINISALNIEELI